MSDQNFPNLEVRAAQEVLREIGVARFVGRINSGVIDVDIGYQVIEEYMSATKVRPVLSRLACALLGRTDPYHHRHE